MESRWTATLVNDQGGWRIRSLHSGVDILDNPILAAAGQSGYLWGVGGILVGALLGWLGGRWRCRASA